MDCRICCKAFDGQMVVPKMIKTCGHTACLACLQKVVPRKCPDCRKPFNEATDLQTNYEMMNPRKAAPKQVDRTKITVKVMTMVDGDYKVEMDPKSTIGALKVRMKVLTGVSEEGQHLMFGGKSLRDDKTLQDYGIKHESAVQLGVRSSGGCYPSAFVLRF